MGQALSEALDTGPSLLSKVQAGVYNSRASVAGSRSTPGNTQHRLRGQGRLLGEAAPQLGLEGQRKPGHVVSHDGGESRARKPVHEARESSCEVSTVPETGNSRCARQRDEATEESTRSGGIQDGHRYSVRETGEPHCTPALWLEQSRGTPEDGRERRRGRSGGKVARSGLAT